MKDNFKHKLICLLMVKNIISDKKKKLNRINLHLLSQKKVNFFQNINLMKNKKILILYCLKIYLKVI